MEGQRLTHYEVLERLGGGGMGVVYRALDTRLNRRVALKFLPPELTRDDDARRRFILEAQAASALDHPNICTIYEIDATPEGQMFIAMALYDGETLKKRIERGPLPTGEALDIAIQVARGLAKAHAEGIVHRDIKPANLMLTKDGFVKIVDFGIAKLLGVTGPTRTGSTLGTVSYMSPEQVGGQDADEQSDLWSLAAVLYEMLTGRRAFKGESEWAVMAAINERQPEPPSSIHPSIPARLDRLVARGLEKEKGNRHASAGELLYALEAAQEDPRSTDTAWRDHLSWRQLLTPRLALPALVIITVAALWGGRAVRAGADARHAREVLIPEIMRLAESDEYGAAYAVAEEVERHIPDDAILAGLWPDVSGTQSFESTPPGADVYYKLYERPEAEWVHLGSTPLRGARLPLGLVRIKVELAGFNPFDYVVNPAWEDPLLAAIELSAADNTSAGLTAVPPQEEFWLEINGFTTHEVYRLPGFEIGTYEVTNEQFMEFVVNGGYEQETYWEHDFVMDGQTMSWEDAMAEFRDPTGRPGPYAWEGGTYPAGDGRHPVRGISWYEAAAYAAFERASLPTAYHWVAAGSPWMATAMIPFSNFGGDRPAPVGAHAGMSQFGAYDMAGNVKEWVWNAVSDSGERYVLGGSYGDQTYKFFEIDTRPAFDRSPDIGFRIALYQSVDEIAAFTLPIEPVTRDYREEEPVGDPTFETFRSLYSYDETPFAEESADRVWDESGRWVRETVVIDAAYRGERIALHLFLPEGVEGVDPPYQTVLHFPGSGVTSTGSVDDYDPPLYDFLLSSGRAVVIPVFDGTFERSHDRRLTFADETAFYRDWMIRLVKDARRAVDYIVTRPDTFRSDQLAYHGFSWGGQMGPLILALDDRYRAAVFMVGGLWNGRPRPEVDPFNFAPRVSVPVLMLNGVEDAVFPVTTSQEPLFDRLRSGSALSQHIKLQAGHSAFGTHRNQIISETLAWFDTHVGPVN